MLPLSFHSAPKIFSTIADTLEWCIQQHRVTGTNHYLHDFMIVAPPGWVTCHRYMYMYLEWIDARGVWRTRHLPSTGENGITCLTFFGIEMDMLSSTSHKTNRPTCSKTWPTGWAGKCASGRSWSHSSGHCIMLLMIYLLAGPSLGRSSSYSSVSPTITSTWTAIFLADLHVHVRMMKGICCTYITPKICNVTRVRQGIGS